MPPHQKYIRKRVRRLQPWRLRGAADRSDNPAGKTQVTAQPPAGAAAPPAARGCLPPPLLGLWGSSAPKSSLIPAIRRRVLLWSSLLRGVIAVPHLYDPAKTRICDSKFLKNARDQGRRALEELVDLEAGEVASSLGRASPWRR